MTSDTEARAKRIWGPLEKKFISRKTGLVYDYASPPDDFPRRAFAQARDAQAGMPNQNGYGAGFAWTVHHLALLVDASLLRLECGVAEPEGEAFAMRLAGGVNALLGAGAKGFLPRGLAADARGHYAGTDASCQAAAAFAVWRLCQTPALDLAFQLAMRQNAMRWIERLERDDFRLFFANGAPAPRGDLKVFDPVYGPTLLALAALARFLAPDAKRRERYAGFADADDRRRLLMDPAAVGVAPEKNEDASPSGDPKTDGSAAARALTPWEGLWRQMALHLVRELDEDEERKALADERMRAYAEMAAPLFAAAAWTPEASKPAPADISFDWRSFPRAPRKSAASEAGLPGSDDDDGNNDDGDGDTDSGAAGAPLSADASPSSPRMGGRRGGRPERGGQRRGRQPAAPVGDETDPGFVAPASWAALSRENASLRQGWAAAAAVLLVDDAETARPHADDYARELSATAWDALLTCSPPALGAFAEARGLALGLWGGDLAESRRVPPAKDESLVARYLTPEYDAENPRRAGHVDKSPPPAPGKADASGPREREAGGEDGRPRRRRRRRR